MCRPASFVLTEKNVFWSKNSDSHEDIKKEFNLTESIAGTISILCIEIVPPDDDYSLPFDKWIWCVDQDILPRWFDAEKDEARTRTELKEWAKPKLKTRVEQENRNTGNRNIGNWNTGNWNTGDRNTGNWNTGNGNNGNGNNGDSNTGNWNTGNRNTGGRNTGNWNTGNRNTGGRNTGNWNTGDSNTGNWNTGDWNSTDFSSGVFCTEEQKIKIFDIQTDLTYLQWAETRQAKLLGKLILNEWISEENMTEEEKTKYPESHCLGGYLKTHDWKTACANMWEKFTEEKKECIKQIPNFDPAKFEQITGIKV
jgi:hypothetical protein